MQTLMKNKENRFIYAVKFIACLFVITIHARIPGTVGDIVMCAARFAVPFFFVVSGRYLLLDGEGNPVTDVPGIRRKLSKSIVKLIKVTAFVYLIHLIFSFTVNMIYKTPVSEYFSSKFNIIELRNFIMFNSSRVIHDWSYVFDHLWFLFALLYVYVLIYIFAPVLRKWYKGLIALLLTLLYFGELLQTYYPIRPFDIVITTPFMMRNWLFVGMPFVLLGILFSDFICKVREEKKEEASEYFNKLKIPAVIAIVLGLVISVIEAYLIDFKDVYFGSLIIVLGILFLSESAAYRGRILALLGKRASSNIYYYHVLVIAVLDLLSQNGFIPAYSMTQKPFIVMAVCFVLFCMGPLYFHGREEKRL